MDKTVDVLFRMSNNSCICFTLLFLAYCKAYIHSYGILNDRNAFTVAKLPLKSISNDISFTTTDIENYAKNLGIIIKAPTNTAISLRLEAFAADDDEKPIGYLNAFIRPIPLRLLQLDTIQVKNRRQNIGYKRSKWTISGPGISFIMGSWALKWAYDLGCREAELLAVKDSEMMHTILVRLYESFGFKILRSVGDDWSSIPDRLVWGAVGTLMKLNITSFFIEWTPKFKSLSSPLDT